MSKEAMKLALEALIFNQANWQGKDKAITALKQALEQPEPEPVAWKETDEVECPVCNDKGFPWPKCGHITYLERIPPKREWQGLTDEEIDEGQRQSWVEKQAFESAVWWAEAKLKEKNT